MNNFEELKVDLVTEAYLKTNGYPKEEIYGLTSQIRRTAVSVSSNIAEECGRKTDRNFSQFLGMALGSAFGFETQLIISKNLRFITENDFRALEKKVQRIRI